MVRVNKTMVHVIKPVCKIANNDVRGSFTWFWKDDGVKCATLNLRGCCVPFIKLVGVM
jgi:hypothetical protein